MKLSILSVAFLGLLLGSCSGSAESTTAKKGEEFMLDDQKMTVDFKASTVLVNEKEQQTLIAPEGKIYLVVDVKGQNSNYFTALKDGDKEIEEVDYLIAKPFVRDLDIATTPDKSMLFLVDINNANYVINVKSFGEVSADIKVGAIKDESTMKINPKMVAFIKDVNTKARVVEAAQSYVKEGVNAADITFENGEPLFGDPITQGLSISNITADGTYVCNVETVLFETIEVTWEGDYITKITMK